MTFLINDCSFRRDVRIEKPKPECKFLQWSLLCRALEKTLSNSSGGEACSEVSGDTDLGSAPEPASPREGGAAVHANPADIQIARIEAEAARQREARASKQKKASLKTEKQVLSPRSPGEGSTAVEGSISGRRKRRKTRVMLPLIS
jgi:hypothetical protein